VTEYVDDVQGQMIAKESDAFRTMLYMLHLQGCTVRSSSIYYILL
jgi:hypothetical protein